MGAGWESLFLCVLYLLSMANVYKNQSSGAGDGGVGGRRHGRVPRGKAMGQHFALIKFFFSFCFCCDEGYEKRICILLFY